MRRKTKMAKLEIEVKTFEDCEDIIRFKRGVPIGFKSSEGILREAAEIYAEQFKPKWISVNERLPETEEIIGRNQLTNRVIVTDGLNTYSAYLEIVNGTPKTKIWSFDCFEDDDDTEKYYGRTVTHWMTLPSFP